MCFSATANFVGGTVIGGIGVATLTQVRQPREVVFAALPLLFGVHQLIEGVVWLGLEGWVPSGLGDAAAYAYLLYAQGVLPVLVPLGLLLIERSRRRRRMVAPFLGIGVLAGAYLFWIDVDHPVAYRIVDHSIAYHNTGRLVGVSAALYLLATCGVALVSGYRWIVAFGVANVIGLTATFIVLSSSFTSVWCAFAAVVSFMILMFYLHRRHQETVSSPA